MKKDELLKSMRDSIGTEEPTVFFAKMVDAFTLLFQEIESLKALVNYDTACSALAIQWDASVARQMLQEVVAKLRVDGKVPGTNDNAFQEELGALKIAIAENKVTQSYNEFVAFWIMCLGYHPFVRYS
jgi:hypothetical protein